MLKRTAHRLLAWSVVFAMLFSLTVQPAAAADTSGDTSAAVYSAQADESTEAETDPADDSGEADESAEESADASAGEDTGETVEEPADESAEEAQDEAQATVSAAAISEEEDESNATVTASSTVTYDEDGFYTDGDTTYYQPAEQNSDGYYEIDNAGKLFWFAALVNGDTTQADITEAVADVDAVLTADIAIPDGYEWTPIGNNATGSSNIPSSTYSGTFDGQEHTISGLIIETTSNYVGLIGHASYATIQNVTLAEDCSLSGARYVGGIVGYSSGCDFFNCTNNGSVTGSSSYVGGIVGWGTRTMTNCTNNGSITGMSTYVGGLIGQVGGSNSVISGCTNTGTVIGSGNYVGGVFGYISLGAVTDCTNSGSVSGATYVGGVAGYNSGRLTGCTNTNSGSITGSGQCVGGVVGFATPSSYDSANTGIVVECDNYGDVEGAVAVGGVVGYSYGKVTSCTNSGSVTGSGSGVGGVVGYSVALTSSSYKMDATITNCANHGDVEAPGYVGGIVGYARDASDYRDCTVANCYSIGAVTATSYAGGVVGYSYGSTVITNCYYLDTAADSGTGYGDGEATAKTEARFNAGEVAYLLQNGQEDTSVQVWGQDLNELTTTDYDDLYPVLTSDSTIKVVQITFEAGTGYTLTETPDPCYTDIGQILVEYPYGYAFYLDKACTNELSTETQTYDTDTTVYVQAETFTITFVYPEGAEEGDFTETITVVMFDDEDAKTHDLTQYVPEGYLYGGLYEDAEFTEDTTSTQCGAAFYYEEDDDTVYYVKLVDESYFQIKCLLAYQVYTPTNLWLVTNIDSDGYASYGFDLLYADDETDSLVVTDEATKQLYQKMEINSKTYTGTVDISDFTGFTDEDYDEDDLDRNLVGYFDLSEMVEELLDADAVTFVPFFVTQDGVKVTGTVQRTVSLTNGATSVSGMYSCEDESVASTTRSTEEDEDSGSMILLLSTSLRVSATALVTNIEDETTTYTITKYDGNTVTTQEVEEGATDVTVEYTEKDGYLFAGWFT
ncbi:MAG: hypothetical protein LUH45_03065, partial [Clostridiales bacterium]|nr:hypothetical protein [Clostridiales bacterium]